MKHSEPLTPKIHVIGWSYVLQKGQNMENKFIDQNNLHLFYKTASLFHIKRDEILDGWD